MTTSTFPIYISNPVSPFCSRVDTNFIIQVFETIWSIGTVERVEFIDRLNNSDTNTTHTDCIVYINDDIPNHNIIMIELKNTGKYSLSITNKATDLNQTIFWELSTMQH
jgi:hypothetical protein